MLYPNLGKNIKKRRQKLGLTQKELAYMIMKSEISIRKYESGKVNIPPSTLFDICTVLNISSEELLGEDSDKYHLTHFGETLEQSLESTRHKYKANLELEEALMNGSDNISELVDKVKKTNKEEVIHYFRELIDSAHWRKLKNVSDEDIYSVVMSVELYAYLQGLFDMQRKENQETLILDKAINIANSKLNKTGIKDLNNLSEIEQKAILEKGLKIADKILKNKEED